MIVIVSAFLLAITIIFTAPDPLSASAGFTILGTITTWKLVSELKTSFIKVNLIGRDLAKANKPIM